ncbi:MAG TPA: hypothetical protein VGN08_11485 [Solirubrobacteraceae bacterium]|jgi:hypothetical protein
MRKPATWIAAAALFVALGGTAVAAKHYLITSTQQIKPNVLKALRAPTASLSVLTTALYGGLAAPGKTSQVTAFCPPGSHAVSGGGESGITRLEVSEMIGDHSGWFIIVNNDTATTVPIHAEAYCAATGQAVASAVASARKRDEAKIAARVRRLAAERTS